MSKITLACCLAAFIFSSQFAFAQLTNIIPDNSNGAPVPALEGAPAVDAAMPPAVGAQNPIDPNVIITMPAQTALPDSGPSLMPPAAGAQNLINPNVIITTPAQTALPDSGPAFMPPAAGAQNLIDPNVIITTPAQTALPDGGPTLNIAPPAPQAQAPREELDALTAAISGLGVSATPQTSSTQVKINRVNIINTWLRLSASGKSQNEIEGYFSNLSPANLEESKEKIREIALNNLSGRLQGKSEISNQADLAQATRISLSVIRNFGLENDSKIRMQISKIYSLPL